MLLHCREQEECIKQMELEKKKMERRYRQLLLALWNLRRQVFHRAGCPPAGPVEWHQQSLDYSTGLAELQGELEEAKGDLRALLSDPASDQPGAGEPGSL